MQISGGTFSGGNGESWCIEGKARRWVGLQRREQGVLCGVGAEGRGGPSRGAEWFMLSELGFSCK